MVGVWWVVNDNVATAHAFACSMVARHAVDCAGVVYSLLFLKTLEQYAITGMMCFHQMNSKSTRYTYLYSHEATCPRTHRAATPYLQRRRLRHAEVRLDELQVVADLAQQLQRRQHDAPGAPVLLTPIGPVVKAQLIIALTHVVARPQHTAILWESAPAQKGILVTLSCILFGTLLLLTLA